MDRRLDKIIVWKNPDGTLRITTVFDTKAVVGNTDDEKVTNRAEWIKANNPDFASLSYVLKDVSELESFMADKPEKKRKLKLNNDGSFGIDEQRETPKEKNEKIRQSIKVKLASLLTPREIKYLLGEA